MGVLRRLYDGFRVDRGLADPRRVVPRARSMLIRNRSCAWAELTVLGRHSRRPIYAAFETTN